MNNAELVATIQEIQGEETDSIILEGDDFADGAVGVTLDGNVVYDYDKLVDALVKAWNCTDTEAIEWIEYNTIRSLPYMESQGTPPIIMTSFE